MMKNKSTLAKLLSEEDINVVYKQMETAYFNSKTRELGLPIWKDEEMSNAEHDLMLGHEVGHALWTPLDMLEAAAARNINHSFVNIIEDARIEKFAKRKYPGLVNVFKRGYKDLVEKDFFGTKDRGIDTFGFIDRINVLYKTGDVSIPFSDTERPLMNRVATVETEEDVLSLAEEIFKFMGENPESNSKEASDDGDAGAPAETDGSGAGGMGSGTDADTNDTNTGDDGEEETGEGNPSAGDNKGEEDGNDAPTTTVNAGTNDDTADGDDDDNDDTTKSKSAEGGIGPSNGSSVPVAETDDISKRVMDMLRDKSAVNRNYANIPKIDSSKYIIGYKEVLEKTTNFYNGCRASDGELFYSKCLEEVETVKKDNKKTVAYMVKEFEMKKSADAYARAATSKTGTLDMSKLHTYKYNEDLFKKVTTLPAATNHGLVMIVDWSGSMVENLKGTIIQTMQLVWFCRRANIPFRVVAFSDAYDYENRGMRVRDEKNPQVFKAGDIQLKDFRLIELFSSNMNLKEETEMMTNVFMMSNRYCGFRNWTEEGYPYTIAPLLNMGGTPLNEAIIVAMDLVAKFKVDAGVQKIHTIFLTDGASNRLSGKFDIQFSKELNEHKDTIARFGDSYGAFGDQEIITDPVNNKKYTVNGDVTNTLLRILKGRVDGMNVVGFFLAGTGRSGRIDKRTISYASGIDVYGAEMTAALKKANKEKFFAVNGDITGYDEYYLLPGGNSLDIDNSGLDDKYIGATKSQLKTAFGKSMKGKISSRVLLNRFIKLVA